MRLLPSFGPAPRRPEPPIQLETKGDTERRATSGGAYMAHGTPYRSSWSIERAVADGLERVVWVYRCVDAIASDESRLPIVWRQGHPEEGDEVKPSAEPLWKLLNRRANPYESAQAFRYRLSTQLLLCKQGVFVEIVRARDKSVSALYLLPPHRTSPIPDPDTFVSGYECVGSSGEIYRLRPEQVLWIRRPHPLDPYLGMTPMESAGLAVDVDFYARMYNRNFMMNDGRPGGVLNVKGYLSQEDADELESRFNGGTTRAGKVTVLESDGVEYVDTSTSARDMQYAETRTAMMKEILMAFGVPETRAGDSSQRTFDNADAEIEMYWRDTMRAHNDIIDSAFDSLTAGGIDDDIFTAHDVSSVYVLNRDLKDRESRFSTLWDKGLISGDEFREGTGREPVKRPGSRVLWVQAQGKLPVGKDADEKTMHAIASGQPPPGEEPAPPPGEEEATGLGPPEEEPDIDWDTWGAEEGGGEGGGGEGGPGGGAGGGGGPGGSASGYARFAPAEADGEDWLSGALVKAHPGTGNGNGNGNGTTPHNTGIMISIDLPDRTANALLGTLMADHVGDAEPADDLHVTLSYLGKVDSAPFTAADVISAVEQFSELAAPLVLAVSGVGHFTIPEGTATYASIDSPDLPDFRHRLVSLLRMRNIESPSEHGFSPHVTLAYTPPGEPPPDIPIEQLADRITQLTFAVPEVSVHWGDDVYRFPLRGRARTLVDLGTT